LAGDSLENLIVTGGLGFIGSNFIHHILRSREDLTITNIDCKGLGSNPANVRELRNNKRYRFVKGNLADYDFTRRALRTANTVVNFAAQTHVDRSIANPEPFFDSNVKGAYNLFQSVLKNKVSKLVHISTDEVYGSTNSGSFDENSPLNPSSPYSATKASADLMANAWKATFKLPVITLRCTNNFGPRQHPEKFIPKSIIRALNGKSVPLYGGGQQIRDWIYVDDFCEAIEQVIEKAPPGEVYNVSAGNELTNRDVADRLLKQIGDPSVRLVNVEDRPGHDFRYSLNSEKARRSFGWRPSHSFDDGLALTVKWYRENASWWKPLATTKILSDAPWKRQW
jgi:dTDP-glucose 4,6-dehydratase